MTVSYRHIKKINIHDFTEDIKKSAINSLDSTMCDDHIKCFNRVLVNLLDKHAPLRSKKTSLQKSQPWFDSTIVDARSIKRSNERKWIKSGLNVDQQAFKDSSRHYYDTTRKVLTSLFP